MNIAIIAKGTAVSTGKINAAANTLLLATQGNKILFPKEKKNSYSVENIFFFGKKSTLREFVLECHNILETNSMPQILYIPLYSYSMLLQNKILKNFQEVFWLMPTPPKGLILEVYEADQEELAKKVLSLFYLTSNNSNQQKIRSTIARKMFAHRLLNTTPPIIYSLMRYVYNALKLK